MRAWRISTEIRKVEVLSNEKATFTLCGFPYDIVRVAAEPFILHGVNIVSKPKPEGQILV